MTSNLAFNELIFCNTLTKECCVVKESVFSNITLAKPNYIFYETRLVIKFHFAVCLGNLALKL